MGTAVRPAKTSPGPWDAFADVDMFVDEVLTELEAMAKDGTRPLRAGPKQPLVGAALRKAVMAIWCVCFCGMQWRAIGVLSDIPFSTLYGLFARWTRLGLGAGCWTGCAAIGGARAGMLRNQAPSSSIAGLAARRRAALTVVSRRQKDPRRQDPRRRRHIRRTVAIDVSPASRHDTKGIVPVLRSLADGGFQGPALGDLGYRGERLAKAGEALGITVEAIARGRDGRFVPAGICWVVERSFAWLSRYRRLNTIFERSKEHVIAFVEIVFISILARRMRRLVTEEMTA